MSGYTVKVDPVGAADGLDVEGEGKRGIKDDSRVWARMTGRRGFRQLRWGRLWEEPRHKVLSMAIIPFNPLATP